MTPQESNELMLAKLWAIGEVWCAREMKRLTEIVERAEKHCAQPEPTASEWDRFLGNGRSDEYDHDVEAE